MCLWESRLCQVLFLRVSGTPQGSGGQLATSVWVLSVHSIHQGAQCRFSGCSSSLSALPFMPQWDLTRGFNRHVQRVEQNGQPDIGSSDHTRSSVSTIPSSPRLWLPTLVTPSLPSLPNPGPWTPREATSQQYDHVCSSGQSMLNSSAHGHNFSVPEKDLTYNQRCVKEFFLTQSQSSRTSLDHCPRSSRSSVMA